MLEGICLNITGMVVASVDLHTDLIIIFGNTINGSPTYSVLQKHTLCFMYYYVHLLFCVKIARSLNIYFLLICFAWS